MFRIVRSLVLFSFSVLLLSCTESKSESPRPEPQDGIPPHRLVACEMSQLTTMDGLPLKAKVSRLWLDPRRSHVLRAAQFSDGRVILNPFTTESAVVSEELKADLSAKGLASDFTEIWLFRFLDRPKALLFKEGRSAGLLVTLESRSARATLASAGGELSPLACQFAAENSVEPHQELIPADPPVIPEPQEGCADGTTEETFGNQLIGCSGTVNFPDRATLCGVGWRVCTAAEWVARFGTKAPTFNYWTDQSLHYSGSGTGSCSVHVTAGSSCQSANAPMRVCGASTDPLGNRCNWTQCGLDTTTNQFFGGCDGNLTAGTICCK